MSDNAHSPVPATGQPQPRRRRTFWIVALVAAAGLTGAVAASAFGHGPGFGPGFGHGFGPGHWRGGFMNPFDPAQMGERADRMVRHLAVEIDATNEQQDKLRAIVKSAVADIAPMREKAQSARGKARELLTQPTIDRAGIERFRTEQVALADAFSKRVAQAVGEAAEVLTPEQRRKLDERLPMHRGSGPPWNR